MLHYFKNTIIKILETILSVIVLIALKCILKKFTGQEIFDEIFSTLIYYFIVLACIPIGFNFVNDTIKFFKSEVF